MVILHMYVYTCTHMKHVYSTLADVQVGREERQPIILAMNICTYLYTNHKVLEETRMPSLENWDGGLKSHIAVLHTGVKLLV